ncbi:polysaccharide deacetylase family protein [Pseudomonas sp. RIT-PI-S]|uniref:polysaccharide deacetylase family protein n=1 Tax=Pseudomonas sp. RIT-PI-S TaxID=3035295 RepID=UPI0021D838BE|nr:polysaccharide deacetylase family protein [Pseudomonas sp. RIT-PI-S]
MGDTGFASGQRSVMLVLHDVAPQTWPDYQPFVEAVDALGNVPMTLLVVPDFHHRNPLDKHPEFRQVLERRIVAGDELALHGYYHADDAPSPRTPRQWFMRRVYTWEGEFYTLAEQQALERIRRGIELFHRHQWPLDGFVAPAWLMSEGTRQALRQLPLSYTSDPQHFYRLPSFEKIQAPGLVWSAGSAWRRGVSKLISEWQLHQWRQAPTVRLGLHPVDMRHAQSRNYWLATLRRLLEEGRVAQTKRCWLADRGALAEAA